MVWHRTQAIMFCTEKMRKSGRLCDVVMMCGHYSGCGLLNPAHFCMVHGTCMLRMFGRVGGVT